MINTKELTEICYDCKNKFKSPAFEAIHSAAAGLSSVMLFLLKRCVLLTKPA